MNTLKFIRFVYYLLKSLYVLFELYFTIFPFDSDK